MNQLTRRGMFGLFAAPWLAKLAPLFTAAVPVEPVAISGSIWSNRLGPDSYLTRESLLTLQKLLEKHREDRVVMSPWPP